MSKGLGRCRLFDKESLLQICYELLQANVVDDAVVIALTRAST